MSDFTLTGPEGQSFKITGPEGATAEEAREVAAAHLAGGAVRGGPRPEPEVPQDFQTWGNLAEARAKNFPNPPEDIRELPKWAGEHPDELVSMGMGGITGPAQRAGQAGVRAIRSHLDELEATARTRRAYYDQALQEGRITTQEHGGFHAALDRQMGEARQRLGLPAESQIRSISAARPSPASSQQEWLRSWERGEHSAENPRGLARTAAEMRASLPAENEQAMVRRALQPRLRAVAQPRDIFAGHGYDDASARAVYDKTIAPHYPNQQAFLQDYFAGAKISESTIRSKTSNGLLIDGMLNDASGNRFGQIQREIYPGDGVAKHEFLKIDSRDRGAGFVRQMTANQIGLYQKMGLERVSLLANIDIGGYAWAKYGWLPEKDEWLTTANEIGERLKMLERDRLIDPRHGDNIRRLLDSPDPRTIWDIADDKTLFDPSSWIIRKSNGRTYSAEPKTNTVGKALLAGQTWGGELYLQNAEQMSRFNHYVTGK